MSATLLLSPLVLQEILADACEELAGRPVIVNSVNIVDYEQHTDPQTGKKVGTPPPPPAARSTHARQQPMARMRCPWRPAAAGPPASPWRTRGAVPRAPKVLRALRRGRPRPLPPVVQSVTAIAQDGRRFSGDLLVGADGIWSKVRARPGARGPMGRGRHAGRPVRPLLGSVAAPALHPPTRGQRAAPPLPLVRASGAGGLLS